MSKKMLRLCGILAANVILLAQTAALPGSAADMTADDISICKYVKNYDSGLTLKREEVQEFNLDDFGLKADDKPTAVMVSYSAELVSGQACMPAFGYYAEGINEYNWYSDSKWIDTPTQNFTVKFYADEEYPMPAEFQLQLWGEDGEALDHLTINAIGIITGNYGGIGPMTRKGDLNDDKKTNLSDVVLLFKYLTGETEELAAAANGDLDRNNRLNAKDLTLLKRGLMDGTIGGSSDTGETAMEFVSHIKVGWNLGNTLDATRNGTKGMSVDSYETGWGCPTTTKAMIDAVKAAGFNCVRVPVSWGEKMDDNCNIREDWMNRVQQVVDYVIDDGMYCIINTHHDTDWQKPEQSQMNRECGMLDKVWTQIANRFEGYDSHLIFETLNEPRLVGTSYEWNGGTSEGRDCVNQMNAASLSAIRKTGGNNTKRFVMMPTYVAGPYQEGVNDFKVPNNDDHVIVSIHAYTPYRFTMQKLEEGGTSQWSVNNSSDTGDIRSNFELLKNKFISKGIPVIIGEFGAVNRNNEDARAEWVGYYISTANDYGIPCIWWDNNQFDSTGENFGLLDRGSCQIRYPKIMQAIVNASKTRG